MRAKIQKLTRYNYSAVTGINEAQVFSSISSSYKAVFQGKMNKLKILKVLFHHSNAQYMYAGPQNTVLPLVGEERFHEDFFGEGKRFYAKVSQKSSLDSQKVVILIIIIPEQNILLYNYTGP